MFVLTPLLFPCFPQNLTFTKMTSSQFKIKNKNDLHLVNPVKSGYLKFK